MPGFFMVLTVIRYGDCIKTSATCPRKESCDAYDMIDGTFSELCLRDNSLAILQDIWADGAHYSQGVRGGHNLHVKCRFPSTLILKH
jgi:hypothetical protein